MSTAHRHDLTPLRHSHAFGDDDGQRRQQALSVVTVLTLVTMVAELIAGFWTGSLALQADGWHMGTHALALGGAVLAYRLSARAAGRAGYAFGGWKIEVLAAYTSALLLLAVALWLAFEGLMGLRQPRPVDYGDAMLVAVIGLVVNLASAWLLARGNRADPKAHAHHHHDHHHHGGHGHDHNFQAAYLHVLADAFTSVLAIAALAGGLWFGWTWLDPAVALLGAVVIGQWSFSVLRSTGAALTDATQDPALADRIRELIESDGDAKVGDLHVWQVGPRAWSAVVAVVADAPLSAAQYRHRLQAIEPLRHVTVEVHGCNGAASHG